MKIDIMEEVAEGRVTLKGLSTHVSKEGIQADGIIQ